jgi:hypothetical protein
VQFTLSNLNIISFRSVSGFIEKKLTTKLKEVKKTVREIHSIQATHGRATKA